MFREIFKLIPRKQEIWFLVIYLYNEEKNKFQKEEISRNFRHFFDKI